jgi:iron complex outermembrane receptor protein
MYLRLSKRSYRRVPSCLAAVVAASILAIASATPGLAQSATELPPLEVETTAKKKAKKKPDVTNTRLTNTTDTSAAGGAGSTGEATGGLGEQVADGGGITGSSTTVITREQIERAPQASLPDIIAREAGVQMTSVYGGVNGAGTKVDLRGFGAASTSNTLVLIDGRRVNDWDLEGFDLSKIAKDSVERVEITRGNSGAVLYGDGAVGGVINIVTRHGAALPNQGRIEGGIGSFQTREGNVSASGSSGPFSAFINANAIESDGYRTNNELQQKSAVADLRWTFNWGSVYVNVAADEQELGLPGSRTAAQLHSDRRGTSTPLDYANKEDGRGTVGFTYMLDPGVELIVDGGIRTKEQEAGFLSPFGDFIIASELTTKSLTPRANISTPFLGLPSRAIAGIDVFDTEYDSGRGSAKGVSDFNIYHAEQSSVAGYWQQTVNVLPSTAVSAGGRIQRNKTRADDELNLFDQPLDASETNYAWHFGVEQELTRDLTVFGRTARSFRVPNVDERIGATPFFSPANYALRTQTSYDWEAGLRFGFGAFQIQSSYYDMQLTDELHFLPTLGINLNLDPTRRRGVETIASWQVMKDVRLSGNLTYTDAVFREGPNAGNEVPLVSRWTGNVGLSWDIIEDALTFDTIVRYIGDRRMDNDQPNFQPLIEAYTTVDVQFGGKIDQFFWSAGVANLTDVEYFDYAIASATVFGVYNAYPLPGRTYMVKAGTTW